MENSKPVLVLGATGLLGSEICRQLVAAHKKVRGMVRTTSDPLKVKKLTDMGVETVIGDLKDPKSLQNAFQNIGAVLSTVSSTLSRTEGDSIESVDRQGQINAIDAAREADVEHFVYISFGHSPIEFPLQNAKLYVERYLQTSGIKFTILRPTFFMEVWLSPHLGFDVHNRKATIYGHGANKITWISLKDVAAFAVASLDNAVANNKIMELGGPEALSPLEVIKILEKESGQTFQLQYFPEEAIQAQKSTTNDTLQQSFSGLMLMYSMGNNIPMEELYKTFNITPTYLHDYCFSLLRPQKEEIVEGKIEV